MSTEQEQETCPSRAYVMDELTECQLDAGHGGVHLGRLQVDGPGGAPAEELVQWRDQDAALDNAAVDELPVWYSALPIGKTVEIGARGGGWANVLLTGAVLDDHEQVAALRVSYRASEQGLPQHVLVPWHAVSSIQWTGDADE